MRPLMIAIALVLTAWLGSAFAADPLGRYAVDAKQISVSGFSSGAFMANQIHIAHSADVMGAALVAGGLYGCAVQSVTPDGVLALASQTIACMELPLLLDDVATYKARIEELASKNWIDPVSNLARSRVYFFIGGSDPVVRTETVETGFALYKALGVPPQNISLVESVRNAGDAWVTTNFGRKCSSSGSPYINNCSYDLGACPDSVRR